MRSIVVALALLVLPGSLLAQLCAGNPMGRYVAAINGSAAFWDGGDGIGGAVTARADYAYFTAAYQTAGWNDVNADVEGVGGNLRLRVPLEAYSDFCMSFGGAKHWSDLEVGSRDWSLDGWSMGFTMTVGASVVTSPNHDAGIFGGIGRTRAEWTAGPDGSAPQVDDHDEWWGAMMGGFLRIRRLAASFTWDRAFDRGSESRFAVGLGALVGP